MKIRQLLPVLAVLALHSTAQASIVTYTNRDAFLAALNGLYFTETFDTVNAFTNQAVFSNGAQSYIIESSDSIGQISIDGDYSISVGSETASLTVQNFNWSVYALGGYFYFDNNAGGVPSEASGTVTVSNGIDPDVIAIIGPATSLETFFGVISTDPITSMRYANNGTTNYINMDDLILSSDSVGEEQNLVVATPEPSTYGMIGLAYGFSVWKLLRRRKRSTTA